MYAKGVGLIVVLLILCLWAFDAGGPSENQNGGGWSVTTARQRLARLLALNRQEAVSA